MTPWRWIKQRYWEWRLKRAFVAVWRASDVGTFDVVGPSQGFTAMRSTEHGTTLIGGAEVFVSDFGRARER